MGDPDIEARLIELEQKLDKIYTSSEKTRKYFLWAPIITAIAVVLPLAGLLFAIPQFLSSYGAR